MQWLHHQSSPSRYHRSEQHRLLRSDMGLLSSDPLVVSLPSSPPLCRSAPTNAIHFTHHLTFHTDTPKSPQESPAAACPLSRPSTETSEIVSALKPRRAVGEWIPGRKSYQGRRRAPRRLRNRGRMLLLWNKSRRAGTHWIRRMWGGRRRRRGMGSRELKLRDVWVRLMGHEGCVYDCMVIWI